MNVPCFVSRRSALAAIALGVAALAAAPAGAEGDIYVHAGANFKPVTIAVTPFAGEDTGGKISGVVAADFARSIFLLPINPANFPETIANPDAAPNIDAWKSANAQFVLTGRVLHQDAGRVTAQFRLWDTATGEQVAGQQYSTDAANARRVAHLIADAVFTRVTGRKGIFRFPRRLRRRDRPEREASQAAGDHGYGRRQREVSRRQRRARRHAAIFAVRPAGRLYVVRRRRPQSDAAQSRERAARVGRQFSRHDFRAPLFARRTANRDVALGRREHQSLHHGLAHARHHPSHGRIRRSTLPRPIRPTARRSRSNPTAADRSRSTS